MASLVFRKTPAGNAEIHARGSTLPRGLRSLLIVINGSTPARILLNHAQALHLPESALADLVRRGLIEPIITTDPAVDFNETGSFAPPAHDPMQRTLVQLRSLELARSYAAAYVRDFAGEASDSLAKLFETTRTIPELLSIVENCAQVIAGVEGIEAAGRFVRRVQRLLPPPPPEPPHISGASKS